MSDFPDWIDPHEAWSAWVIRRARQRSSADRPPEHDFLRHQWMWVGEIRSFFPEANVGKMLFDTVFMWDSLPASERTPLTRDERVDNNPEARAWILAKCAEYKAIAKEEGLEFPAVMMGGLIHAEARRLFPGIDAVGMVFDIAREIMMEDYRARDASQRDP